MGPLKEYIKCVIWNAGERSDTSSDQKNLSGSQKLMQNL